MHSCAGWLRNGIQRENVKKAVSLAKRRLKKIDFTTVVFTGVSGALIAPIVAYELGKEVIVVRKKKTEEGGTHSIYDVEGFRVPTQKYVIIDDIIDSGASVARMVQKVREFAGSGAELVGVYTYATSIERSPKGFSPVTHPKVKSAIELANQGAKL